MDLGALPAALDNLMDNDNVDWFSFAATSGADYTVSIVDSNCQSGDQSSLQVTAYRADGSTQLGFDKENASEECASVTFSAPANETIYVKIDQRNLARWGETYGLRVTSP